ncbi:hypothetical protein M8J76_001606 [Diaphorina citri]|nr:hypothetical protein M8J76_001606 [Diaphorina citri]
MDSSSETSSVATVASENEEMVIEPIPPIEPDVLGRQQVLGFKPQREIIYSKYLPYADKIDDESLEKLKDKREREREERETIRGERKRQWNGERERRRE